MSVVQGVLVRTPRSVLFFQVKVVNAAMGTEDGSIVMTSRGDSMDHVVRPVSFEAAGKAQLAAAYPPRPATHSILTVLTAGETM